MTAIDDAHCDLIFGLVRAFKPKRVLEFGYGTGTSALAINRALEANGGDFLHLIVDNWLDFAGKHPEIPPIKLVTRRSDEEEFVQTTKQKFDFILCDGDHTKTDRYWRQIYGHLLNRPGIALFHDVSNPDYPNLRNIVSESSALPQALFHTNSHPGERCDRGLLVLFK